MSGPVSRGSSAAFRFGVVARGIRSRYSTTVTSEPRRRDRAEFEADDAGTDDGQVLGDFGKASAPVEETMVFSSIVTPGGA